MLAPNVSAERNQADRSERHRGQGDQPRGAKEASLGLKAVTDGEYRRSFWSRDFFRHLDNVETFSTPNVKRFQGSQPKTLAHRPTAKLGSFIGPSDDRAFPLPQIGRVGRHRCRK